MKRRAAASRLSRQLRKWRVTDRSGRPIPWTTMIRRLVFWPLVAVGMVYLYVALAAMRGRHVANEFWRRIA